MKDTYLCTCTHCENILIDENPQIGAPLYDLKDYPKALEMVKVFEELGDPETQYWACPICLTDGFLADEVARLQNPG